MTSILEKLFGAASGPTEITGRDLARCQSMIAPEYRHQTAGQGQTVTGQSITTSQVGGWGGQPQPGTTFLPYPHTPSPVQPYIQRQPQRVDLTPESMLNMLRCRDMIKDFVRSYAPGIIYANIHNLKRAAEEDSTFFSSYCDRELVLLVLMNQVLPEGDMKRAVSMLRLEYMIVLDAICSKTTNSNYHNFKLDTFEIVPLLRKDSTLQKMKEDYDSLSGLDKVI